jgi:RHS repeat-associated protein
LYGKGEAVGTAWYDTERYSGGKAYLGKDVMGSVWSATDEYGAVEGRYEYDVFGEVYEGDMSGGMKLGYTGKPYDAVTGMYDYGYRDYRAEDGRFTTEDPVRDGANWFAYVNNDPVNWIALWGLWIKNLDGTYTAEAGDTLSGLSAQVAGSGNNWGRYEFAGDPTKTIDPKTLQIGSVISVDNIIGFSNADQAAANIMPKINPASQTQKIEYGGFIYVQDGKTYYTRPTTDNSENSWDPTKHGVSPTTPGASQYILNSDEIVSGWYHTHPFVPDPVTGINKYDSSNFSGWIYDPVHSPTGYVGDMHTSDVTGLTAYMIDPYNQMQKYTPPSSVVQPPYTSAPSSILGGILSLQSSDQGFFGMGTVTSLKTR